MTLQKSACIECMYQELPFLERFQAAAADGFPFVEFWSWTDKDLDAVRDAAERANIGIAGFNGDAELSLIDPAQQADYLAFLALYGLLPTQFDEKELYLSRTMREAYTSEMVRHEYLTPVRDGFRAVAHSLFGDGTEVVANFTDSPFLYEGRETPPHDFILFKRGEK